MGRDQIPGGRQAIIFLRHPKPVAENGVCYGRTDLDIGAEGEAQIVGALAATPPAMRVIASPARRCRALAVAIAERDGAPLSFDARLWEMDFGAWEGRCWDEIPAAESEPWSADPWNVAPPDGETFTVMRERVAAALLGAGPGTTVVCHAGPIRMAWMIFTGADFSAVCAEPVPYARPIPIARVGS